MFQTRQRVPGYPRLTLRSPGLTPAASHPSPRRRHPRSRCRKGRAATCREVVSAAGKTVRTERLVSLAPGALDTPPPLSHVGPQPGAPSPESTPHPPPRGRTAAGQSVPEDPGLGPGLVARPRPRPPLRRGPRGASRGARRAPCCREAVRVGVARPRTYSAVGCRPVPAAAARGAASDGGPVPHRPAASIHPRGGLHRAAAAALGAGPAATPASAATASLAPVQLNDVVQRHIHFVGHGGRGIGPRIEPARQHAAASLPAPAPGFPASRPSGGR